MSGNQIEYNGGGREERNGGREEIHGLINVICTNLC